MRSSLAGLLGDNRILCQFASISRLVVNNLLYIYLSRNVFSLVTKENMVDLQFAISWECDAVLRFILNNRVVLVVL